MIRNKILLNYGDNIYEKLLFIDFASWVTHGYPRHLSWGYKNSNLHTNVEEPLVGKLNNASKSLWRENVSKNQSEILITTR